MAGAKRGGGGEGEKRLSPIPLPFSLPPYPLPISKPATQANTGRQRLPPHLFLRACKLVLSPHPDPNFRSIPKSRELFPASRACFQSRVLPPFCFKISNPGLQIREIPDAEKTYWDPPVRLHVQVSCSGMMEEMSKACTVYSE